jgi:hypothetical protein
MHDSLRGDGVLPLTEPYSALGYTYAGGGGGETVAPAVLTTIGPNAIVDWVVVELSNNADPQSVLFARPALVQRDGDVVALDGTSALSLATAPGNYYVALRHRNHFGAMTAAPVALGATPTAIDLTSAATATYGTNARKDINGTQVLWSGDVNRDGILKYTNTANDRDLILVAIGGIVPTSTVTGYRAEDVNLDGVVKYTGGANDRDIILQNIGGVVPTNVRLQQLP